MSPRTRERRRAIKTRVRQVLGGALAIAATTAALAVATRDASPSLAPHHRMLVANATNANGEEEEDSSCKDLADWERNGGIVVYICALLYIFVSLAIICDDYFVTALEKITEKLGLSKDVAGATFMAAGSSAPELFVSLADNVFAKPQESLGIGTIVGSAIFNILVIISLSALLAGQDLVLDWRPLLRDSLWYSWAIIALTYSVWDGHVDVYESALLFGSYACYCVYMSQNERIVTRCCKRPDDIDLDAASAADDAVAVEKAAALAVAGAAVASQTTGRPWTIDVERREETDTAATDARPRKTSDSSVQLRRAHSSSHTGDGDLRAKFAAQASNVNPIYQSKYRMFQYHPSLTRQQTQHSLETGASAAAAPASTTAPPPVITVQDVGALDGDEALGPYFAEVFDVPKSFLGKLWFVFTWPIVVIARVTIPDCRYPQFSGTCGFTATFLVAIVWIAFLSHYTVVYATKFGCIAGIPSALMGLTIIAAGTSIPDALSSILVARDGHGDMAVSNALGSNVFDILLGLGLPFFLSNLVYHEPVAVAGDDLELSIFILFGILFTLVVLLILSRWRLRKSVGGLLALLYIVYVVVSYLRGLGMI